MTPISPSYFPDAVAFVLSSRIEGGYVNDPDDPGKETNRGITRATLTEAQKAGIVPLSVTIPTLTRVDAIAIYHHLFWSKMRCDYMPYPVALVVFDTAVNHGLHAAADWLQAAVGATQDGLVGEATIRLVEKAPVILTVRILCKRRLEFYLHEEPPVQEEKYELGWANRLMDLQAEAIIAAFTVGAHS